jgi:hypothetical protein
MKRVLSKGLLIAFLAALLLAGVPILVIESGHGKPRTLQEFLGPPEMSKVDPDKPLREQTRTFELAGRRFEIPIMYIDGRPKPGEHQESMLLEVIWPEMRSIWELKDRAEYDRIRKEEHRLGWILLEPEATSMPLEDQNRVGEESLTRFERAGDFHGLEKGLWFRGPDGDPELWAEVYVERDDDGNLASFIRCRRGPSVRFPGCRHKFVSGGLLFDISYNETRFLPEWREQRQRAVQFIRSFEILPENITKNGEQ